MSPNMKSLLERLCRCEPNKGIPLAVSDRRVAGALISKGYVYSIGFGKFHVYIATDKGRAALTA